MRDFIPVHHERTGCKVGNYFLDQAGPRESFRVGPIDFRRGRPLTWMRMGMPGPLIALLVETEEGKHRIIVPTAAHLFGVPGYEHDA